MKEEIPCAEKPKERLSAARIAEALLVGVVGGLLVLFYRVAVTCAARWLGRVLLFIQGNPFRTAGWFVVLMLLALITGRLIKWEPMIAGGGIPMVKREINGTLIRHWKRIIPARFTAGCLCLLGGLSLGRFGPSIQFGAMAGQGVSQILGREEEEERSLMACGAGAGLAASFHAPLAGMIFVMEEIYKKRSMPLCVYILTSVIAADFSASCIIGADPVFSFGISRTLPRTYYWLLLLLGIFLGIAGAFYSRIMLKVQEMYKRLRFLNETGRVMTAFFLAGVLGIVMPSVLGGGNDLIQSLTQGEMLLGVTVLAFAVKFLFSAICFGSGAPGGNVFPLLTLGALLGGIFAMAGVKFFGLDPVYINHFVLLAMAGHFSAVLRAPVTGIVLLSEMSGSVSQFLPLAIVSVTAYIVSVLGYPRLTEIFWQKTGEKGKNRV